MTSTVEISDKAKQEISKLITYLSLKTNRPISQKELLDVLIESSTQNMDQLLTKIKRSTSEHNWKEDSIFHDVTLSLDVTTSETIDDVVYGDKE